MKNQAIAVIDSNIGGLLLVKSLMEKFPSENFIYLNIPSQYKQDTNIEQIANEYFAELKSRNVRIIIVACEKLQNQLNSLSFNLDIPLFFLNKSIIRYVNNNFENKNMLFLASSDTIDSSLFQKNLRSDQLYSISTDVLIEIVNLGEVKTPRSFREVIELLTPYNKKHIDILVAGSTNLELLKTEFLEVLPSVTVISIYDVLISSLGKYIVETKKRIVGRLHILTLENKRTLKQKLKELNLKIKSLELLELEKHK